MRSINNQRLQADKIAKILFSLQFLRFAWKNIVFDSLVGFLVFLLFSLRVIIISHFNFLFQHFFLETDAEKLF